MSYVWSHVRPRVLSSNAVTGNTRFGRREQRIFYAIILLLFQEQTALHMFYAFATHVLRIFFACSTQLITTEIHPAFDERSKSQTEMKHYDFEQILSEIRLSHHHVY